MRGAEERAESHIDKVLSVHRWEWFLVVLVDPFLDMQSPNAKQRWLGLGRREPLPLESSPAALPASLCISTSALENWGSWL